MAGSVSDPFGLNRYSIPAAGPRQSGILGHIDGASGGLIPLPPAAGPQAGYRPSLTAVDLARASAPWLEKIGRDLRAPLPRWSPKDHTVILSDAMKEKADAIARDFHARTGKELVVTDGARTAADQARAMFNKFAQGDTTTYRGPNGRKVRAIYDDGVASQKDRQSILSEMAAMIEGQRVDGRSVYRHMDDKALDFGIKGVTTPEAVFLEELIRRNGGPCRKARRATSMDRFRRRPGNAPGLPLARALPFG